MDPGSGTVLRTACAPTSEPTPGHIVPSDLGDGHPIGAPAVPPTGHSGPVLRGNPRGRGGVLFRYRLIT